MYKGPKHAKDRGSLLSFLSFLVSGATVAERQLITAVENVKRWAFTHSLGKRLQALMALGSQSSF